MTEFAVSLALCTYNGAAFLKEQLDSIALQTRPPDEIVVCDDASCDETIQILQSFAATAPFSIRITINEVTVGAIKNFEKAISRCAGTVIFLCDQDDFWHPEKIERMLKPFADFATGAVFSNAEAVGPDLTPLGYSLWDACGFKLERRQYYQAGGAFVDLLRSNVVQGASLAFRASFREAILPFPLCWSHDHWSAVILAACSEIRFLDEQLMLYRQHGSNLLGAPRPRTGVAKWWYKWWYKIHAALDKLRAPGNYYRKKLSVVDKELDRLAGLSERLIAQKNSNLKAHIAAVKHKIRRVEVRRQQIERRLALFARNPSGSNVGRLG